MRKRHLIQDLFILIVSIAVAILLAETALLDSVLSGAITAGVPLKAFIAGLFFTSAFTTAPAAVILGKLSQNAHLLVVALYGAAGAVAGDYLIFRFIRDRLGEDLSYIIGRKAGAKLRHLLTARYARWMSPFVAMLIIASPLPDELAITILGLTRIKTVFFIPFVFTANFIGLLLVGLVAQAL
jgi:hypothetical protein